jgi:hypothetical protein
LLVEANGVFRQVGVSAGFHLDEHEHVTLPGDDVHFPAFNPIAGTYDSVAQTAEIADSLDFRIAAEWKEAA